MHRIIVFIFAVTFPNMLLFADGNKPDMPFVPVFTFPTLSDCTMVDFQKDADDYFGCIRTVLYNYSKTYLRPDAHENEKFKKNADMLFDNKKRVFEIIHSKHKKCPCKSDGVNLKIRYAVFMEIKYLLIGAIHGSNKMEVGENVTNN